MFHSYVSGVENAPLPSCIPEENAPAPSCIRTQCWSRGMRYKKSGRHYSCMGRVSREGQCDMLAWMKNRMRNALNMHRERIATCQLTLSPGYDVPLLRHRSRECSTAILYTRRECSTAILYTSRECSTAILYTSSEWFLRHRVYVPSAGAGGCAIRSLVGTTATWEE